MNAVQRIVTSVIAVALIGGAGLAGPPARAAEPSALNWLMNEPVTLFDIGILRLRQAMAEVADWLEETGQVDEPPISGAYYQWRERQVIIYVTVRETRVDPAEATCRLLFSRIVERLMTGVPAGTRRAEMYLETLFLHTGPGNFGRPRTLGTELVEALRLEVTLLPPSPLYAGGQSVRCSGPLDAAAERLSVQVSG